MTSLYMPPRLASTIDISILAYHENKRLLIFSPYVILAHPIFF